MYIYIYLFVFMNYIYMERSKIYLSPLSLSLYIYIYVLDALGASFALERFDESAEVLSTTTKSATRNALQQLRLAGHNVELRE